MEIVLYILPFGLVRLITFRLAHGLVSATLTQMLRHARRGCVIHRCQNKNPREKLRPRDVNDVMHRKRGLRIFVISEKAVS